MTAFDAKDFEAALADPKGKFGTPQAVLAAPGLSIQQKREILLRWEHDARQLQVASEEGMDGGERPMLRDVLQALDRVSAGRKEAPAVLTKTGGSRHC